MTKVAPLLICEDICEESVWGGRQIYPNYKLSQAIHFRDKENCKVVVDQITTRLSARV